MATDDTDNTDRTVDEQLLPPIDLLPSIDDLDEIRGRARGLIYLIVDKEATDDQLDRALAESVVFVSDVLLEVGSRTVSALERIADALESLGDGG